MSTPLDLIFSIISFKAFLSFSLSLDSSIVGCSGFVVTSGVVVSSVFVVGSTVVSDSAGLITGFLILDFLFLFFFTLILHL